MSTTNKQSGKAQKKIETLTINCNQVSIKLKNKQTKIVMLKKGSRKSNARCEVRKEERKEERKNESDQCRKKECREKVSRTEQSKKIG